MKIYLEIPLFKLIRSPLIVDVQANKTPLVADVGKLVGNPYVFLFMIACLLPCSGRDSVSLVQLLKDIRVDECDWTFDIPENVLLTSTSILLFYGNFLI